MVAQKTYAYKLDKTPPQLTNVIIPTGANLTDTTARITFTADDIGKFCYLVKSPSDPPPTVSEILNDDKSSKPMTADATHTIELDNLAQNTPYKVYIAAEDKASNQPASATVVSFTTNTPMIYGTLVVSDERTYGENITLSVLGGPPDAVYFYENSHGGTDTQNVFSIIPEFLNNTTFTVTAEGYDGELTIDVVDFKKRPLTVTAAVDDKVYDGSTNATVRFTVGNATNDYPVTATATATFVDANAGENKPVTLSNFDISHVDKEHFEIYTADVPTGITASITPAPLTGITIDPIDPQTYTGSVPEPALTVKAGGNPRWF